MWTKLLSIFRPKIDRKHIRILVIEDTEVDQRVACAAIERGGYTSMRACDGKTGVNMAKEQKPDMIILDYNLPDAKGPQICEILKNCTETHNIPVLFLTSMDSPESIINCYEKGGTNYLSKPISPGMLLKHIELTLKDKNEEC